MTHLAGQQQVGPLRPARQVSKQRAAGAGTHRDPLDPLAAFMPIGRRHPHPAEPERALDALDEHPERHRLDQHPDAPHANDRFVSNACFACRTTPDFGPGMRNLDPTPRRLDRPPLPHLTHHIEQPIAHAPHRRIGRRMRRIHRDPPPNRLDRHPPQRIAPVEPLPPPEDQRMIRHHQIRAPRHRLGQHRLGQINRQQHPPNRRITTDRLDEQTDVVPRRGELQWRDLAQSGEHDLQGDHPVLRRRASRSGTIPPYVVIRHARAHLCHGLVGCGALWHESTHKLPDAATPIGGAVSWEEVKLARKHKWDEGLYTLVLDRCLDFKAGQFVNLGLVIDDKRIKRAYSIGSAPGEPLEFFIVEVDGGALTPRALAMQPGDTLLLNPRPAGFFTLDYVNDGRDLWMVSSGTGLAPFVAMLRQGDVWNRFQRIVVLHGVRHARQLAYVDEFRRHADAHPGRLVYAPIVSRDPDVQGVLHGRVTTALQDGQLEALVGHLPDPAHDHVMLCGNPAMLDEMQALLEARGLAVNRRKVPGHITVERYW